MMLITLEVKSVEEEKEGVGWWENEEWSGSEGEEGEGDDMTGEAKGIGRLGMETQMHR